MSLRRFLNLVYHMHAVDLDADGRKALDHMLEAKWDHEMTRAEKKREEAFRRTLAKGGVQVQRDLVDRFNQTPVERKSPRMPKLIGAVR